MDNLRTAMKKRGLVAQPAADPATLLALQAHFANTLPAWLIAFLSDQNGMSLGPVECIDPFTRMRAASISLEWIASANEIAERSALQNSRRGMEVVVLAEIESDLIVEFLAGPLAGYIAHFPHDDGARLICHCGSEFIYRTVEFVTAGMRDPSQALHRIKFELSEDDAALGMKILADHDLLGTGVETQLLRILVKQMVPALQGPA